MPHAADIGLSRRTFLGAVAAAPLVATAVTGAAPTPVRLGGPIFLKSDDPVALAKEHRRLGYSAAYCPAASPTDGDLSELSKLPVDAPLMLEHLQTAEEYDAGRAHIQSVGARIGVAFA